ncbi:hypothetical protein [Rhodospirillum rubrum]|uniref:Uncharacterized protein n=1 Tax=Rhodospirillum rubrum (strain ATCC 11170 / ATH 1.1.1 / DSM 467 / LMG 4362 / NCIMB 8255 / S1) TaxID=269796 RepID=Q2RXX8_RHORT|nr:hypothetical protein [Rhodospirillum rubrum]ABC21017.1 hypothetical protein Rru_A0212 [Rhodospirillum rubrum ATCC 11170]AEO46683.1 hypothetical protein F11_01065 [Rhodospirillum rubrum F11]QXG80713.1 hypothetical protein KUL73_01125 [Rhodospirillum rubrum]
MGWIDALWNRLLGDPKAAAKPPPTRGGVKKTGRPPAATKGKPAPGKAGTKAAAAPVAEAGSAREKALAQVRAAQGDLMTPERAELIRKAMQVHGAKQKILANLSDEQRQRLVMTAMRTLLNEGRDKDS